MRRCTCVDDERTCREHNINRTELERLRARERDLKARLADREARLARVRQLLAPCDTYDDCVECRMYQRITDLRRKNWREP